MWSSANFFGFCSDFDLAILETNQSGSKFCRSFCDLWRQMLRNFSLGSGRESWTSMSISEPSKLHVWNWDRISVAGQGSEKAAAAHVDDAVLQRDCLLPRPDRSRGREADGMAGWAGQARTPPPAAAARAWWAGVRHPALDRRAPTQPRA